MPEIRIGGFNQHTLGGNQSWPLYTTPNQTLQFTDSATYVDRQAQSEIRRRIPHRQHRQSAEHVWFRRDPLQRSGKLYHRRYSQRQFRLRGRQPAHRESKIIRMFHSGQLARNSQTDHRCRAALRRQPADSRSSTICWPISIPQLDWCRWAGDSASLTTPTTTTSPRDWESRGIRAAMETRCFASAAA